MSDVKWIKISTDIFDNRKIKQIEHMPEGDALIVIWFKLLILAGDTNDGGQVYLTQEIPYTEPLLANQFNRPLPLIQLALRTFEQFNMIEIIDDIIHISNWEKYQNIDGMERIREQTKLRTRAWRERKALCDATVTSQVTECDGDVTEQNKNKIENKNNIVSKDTPSSPSAEDEFEVDEDEELNSLLQSVVKKHEPSVLTKTQKDRFEKFWNLYPKKQNRKEAEKAWKKIDPSPEETNSILCGLKRSIEKDSRFREKQFTPLPATWLNAGGWEDEFADEEEFDHLEYRKDNIGFLVAVPKKKGIDGDHSFDADDFLQAATRRRKK